MIRTLLLLLLFAPAALAQPERPAPPPLEPRAVISDFIRAYTREPIAERVTVLARPQNKPPFRSDLILRIDPGVEEDHADRAILLLLGAQGTAPGASLGTLRIYSSRGRLIAEEPRNPRSYFLAENLGADPVAALARVMPPLPLPQFAAITAAGADAFTAPTPWTTAVRWTSAARDETAQPPRITLRGVSNTGEVTLTLDAKTSRLRRFTAVLADNLTFSLTVRPLATPDAPIVPIATEGRERVPTIADLGAGGPESILGQVFPRDTAFTIAGAPFVLADEFRPLPQTAPNEKPRFLLLTILDLTEPADGAPSRAELLGVASDLVDRLKAARGTVIPGAKPIDGAPQIAAFSHRTLVILPPDEGPTPDREAAIRAKLDGAGVLVHVPETRLLVCAEPPAAAARFTAKSKAAILVLDSDMAVRAVLPLDPARRSTQDALDQLMLPLITETEP